MGWEMLETPFHVRGHRLAMHFCRHLILPPVHLVHNFFVHFSEVLCMLHSSLAHALFKVRITERQLTKVLHRKGLCG